MGRPDRSSGHNPAIQRSTLAKAIRSVRKASQLFYEGNIIWIMQASIGMHAVRT